MDRRFEQSDIGMIRTIESLLLDASNGKQVQMSDNINWRASEASVTLSGAYKFELVTEVSEAK